MRIHEVKWVDLSESEDPYIVKHGLNKPVVVHSFAKISLEPLTTPAE
jgi:hypothetical protein